MAFEDTYLSILEKLPGIANPIKRLTFKAKLKWTGIILLLYFIMSQIMVWGVAPGRYEYFQYLQMIMGSNFGSLVTLGIGPIVTAAIILQLMVGSKLIPWDLNTERGKSLFQGTQKLMAILFCMVEAWAFVAFGAIAAQPGFFWIVILQIAVGGWLLIFMDEMISKWGFGSGVGLFIVAGVSSQIITKMFNPLTATGGLPTPGASPVGAIPAAITSMADPFSAFLILLPVIATFLVFFLVVYAQALKVEVPLAFGSIRGFGRRWPLKFFYTSNIPVILIGALLANIQMMGRMASQGGSSWLASVDANGNIVGGVMYFLQAPRTTSIAGFMVFAGIFAAVGILLAYFTKKSCWKFALGFAFLGILSWFFMVTSMGFTSLAVVPAADIVRIFVYSCLMIGGSIVFSLFWVNSAGMDARSVANQIQSTGMQIPGYRRDIRIIERVLNRYIPSLAVLGAAAVGALAAYADFTLALGTGTGILLATMIIFNLYEEIAMQHMEDMHPAVRRFIGR